ncbi:DDRGK domain-containing protein 1 [Stomoxys calcitrans]|uniref:DDRGK domain-containing protein 1 n=1 Tax=Stomoxys calcitrans TaxID=35570 RepID=UPI0027E33616|nr:DDRGK domain-containing protein 1 [Stomoxys calcitrans]
MSLTLLIGCATALVVLLVTLLYLQKKRNPEGEPKQQHAQQRGVPQRAQEGVPRRAQIVRNQRNRLRQNAAAPVAAQEAAQRNESDNENEEGEIPQGQVLDEKMGAKKRAKMEAKEQKRLMREQEMKLREEKKAKDAKEEEERKKLEDQEAEEERKKEEAERLAREEQERREHEEYLKMKAAFSVEEEGYEEGDEEKENLLGDFIKYIKDNKVVVLEDLATEFKLKTQQAIERIQELQANGSITGVIDDRGKFIYISEEELASVAKFIRQRGRVSIQELAESSNNLINLTPVATS